MPAIKDSNCSSFSEIFMTADHNSSAASRPAIWKTVLLLVGSAAFGGVAVALWNRRELTRMHEQLHENGSTLPAEQYPAVEEDFY